MFISVFEYSVVPLYGDAFNFKNKLLNVLFEDLVKDCLEKDYFRRKISLFIKLIGIRIADVFIYNEKNIDHHE